MNPASLTAHRSGRRACAAGPANGVQGLEEHQSADHTQKEHVGQLDQQIDLPEFAQYGEDLNADRGPDQTPDEQDQPHSEIHRLSLEMRQNAGKGRGDNLVRLGRDGDGGGDADHEKEWRHQKTATHAEHAGQDAYQSTQS